jgi:hypothetical protein
LPPVAPLAVVTAPAPHGAGTRLRKDNNVLPDYICWHFPKDVIKEADECRRLLKAEHLQDWPLMVNLVIYWNRTGMKK